MDESVRDCIPELLGQEKALFEGGQDIRTYSPLALAFIGDAVFSLYIRTMIVAEGNTAPGKLHKRSSELVRPVRRHVMTRDFGRTDGGGAECVPSWTQCPGTQRAKNATMSEYRHATGLESLFGYLYLTGQADPDDGAGEKMCGFLQRERRT